MKLFWSCFPSVSRSAWFNMLLCSLLLLVSCAPTSVTFAATPRVYEYNNKGQLTVMYTAKQKTTYAYDNNGNLYSKQVEAGNYNSIVDPGGSSESDPTRIPPPVPVPTQSGLPTRYWVDQVQQTAVSTTCGGIQVSGWYLNPAGIQTIEIYVDGVFRGRAAMGDSREDVYNAYPAYNNHIAGFHADNLGCTTSEFQRADGTKGVQAGDFRQNVEIRMIDRAHQVTTSTRIINVTVLPPAGQLPIRYWVDQVQQSSAASAYGSIQASGWYVDPADIQRIEVYIDGKFHGKASVGDRREDVYNAYPAYDRHTAGFHVDNMPILTEGTPHVQRKADGTNEVVPGIFDHLVELRMINQENQVTTYKKRLAIHVN